MPNLPKQLHKEADVLLTRLKFNIAELEQLLEKVQVHAAPSKKKAMLAKHLNKIDLKTARKSQKQV